MRKRTPKPTESHRVTYIHSTSSPNTSSTSAQPQTRRAQADHEADNKSLAEAHWASSSAGAKHAEKYPNLAPRHFLAHTRELPRSRTTLLFRLITGPSNSEAISTASNLPTPRSVSIVGGNPRPSHTSSSDAPNSQNRGTHTSALKVSTTSGYPSSSTQPPRLLPYSTLSRARAASRTSSVKEPRPPLRLVPPVFPPLFLLDVHVRLLILTQYILSCRATRFNVQCY
ncbi:hypothetical protein OPQ81_009122 [Rhizoctonia solani]|nr:hypothetical protein OPQ81_009122 [Rhizoctonia solani]